MPAVTIDGMECVSRTDELAQKLRIQRWGTEDFNGTLYQSAWVVFEGMWRFLHYPRGRQGWNSLFREINLSINQAWPAYSPHHPLYNANQHVRARLAEIANGIGIAYDYEEFLKLLSLDHLKQEYIDNHTLLKAVAQISGYTSYAGGGVVAAGIVVSATGSFLGLPVVVGGGITIVGGAITLTSTAAQTVTDFFILKWINKIKTEGKRRITIGEWTDVEYNKFFSQFAPGEVK